MQSSRTVVAFFGIVVEVGPDFERQGAPKIIDKIVSNKGNHMMNIAHKNILAAFIAIMVCGLAGSAMAGKCKDAKQVVQDLRAVGIIKVCKKNYGSDCVPIGDRNEACGKDDEGESHGGSGSSGGGAGGFGY